MAQGHRNDPSVYVSSARGSFVLLRSKNKIKLPIQNVEKWIYMEKWAWKSWGNLFLKDKKARVDQHFSEGPYATNASPRKLNKKLLKGQNKCCLESFQLKWLYFGREHLLFGQINLLLLDVLPLCHHDRDGSVVIHLASLARPILVCWWQMMTRTIVTSKRVFFW